MHLFYTHQDKPYFCEKISIVCENKLFQALSFVRALTHFPLVCTLWKIFYIRTPSFLYDLSHINIFLLPCQTQNFPNVFFPAFVKLFGGQPLAFCFRSFAFYPPIFCFICIIAIICRRFLWICCSTPLCETSWKVSLPDVTILLNLS